MHSGGRESGGVIACCVYLCEFCGIGCNLAGVNLVESLHFACIFVSSVASDAINPAGAGRWSHCLLCVFREFLGIGCNFVASRRAGVIACMCVSQ